MTLHRFAVVLACLIVLLIAAGALVKSKEAGLSVPDWPTSYGGLNPPRWYEIENVRAEHGHRLFAGLIALLTVVLAVWTARAEPRRWVRRLAWGAVATVLAQAVLGGLTVRFFLPPPVSIAHAALAELFLCLVTAMAVVTSPGWAGQEGRRRLNREWLLVAVVYFQILLGAVMRHYGAGLAIPDFPLAFGRLVPPRFDFRIGIHYAHRLGALAVLLLVAVVVADVLRRRRHLLVPGVALVVLVLTQISLGAATVLSGRAVLPNTLHVANGAALLATSLVLALRASCGGTVPETGAAPRPAAPREAVA